MPKGGVPGNKGGGRKSAYQERADAELLWRLFTDPDQLKKLEEKIKAGKHSVMERMVFNALQGNERLISEMYKKLFPDLEKVEHSGGVEIKVVDYEDGSKK